MSSYSWLLVVDRHVCKTYVCLQSLGVFKKFLLAVMLCQMKKKKDMKFSVRVTVLKIQCINEHKHNQKDLRKCIKVRNSDGNFYLVRVWAVFTFFTLFCIFKFSMKA